MLVSGIRSFSDRDEHSCSFYSPLTVIVGANGSGKTTIIECLKYAATGVLPPNSKGGAFIYDPHMAGTPQVHAHVSLIFRNNRGERFMVQRKLMVSAKSGGALSMSTVEGMLYKDDPENRDALGKNPAISGRCNNVDDLVPRELGASKAILENVIFCHQEDSNWPMSEPAKLKVKFDEIFEVTKWTKELTNVNNLLKERVVQCKIDNKELEALQRDTEIQAKLERKILALETEYADKQQLLDELVDDIDERVKHNQEIAELAADAQKAINDLELLEERLELRRQERQSLQVGLELMEDSDSGLRARLDGFQEYLERLEQDEHTKKRAAASVRQRLDALERDAQTKHAEMGGLESRVRSYQDLSERRNERVRVLSRNLGIRGFDRTQALSQSESAQFDAHLDAEMSRRSDALRGATTEAKQTVAVTEEELNKLQGETRRQEGVKATLQRTRQAERTKVQQLEARVQEYILSETSGHRMQAEVAGEEAKLEHAQRAQAEGQFERRLSEARRQTSHLQDEVEQLNAKLRAFNASSMVRARLDLKQSEHQDKLNQASDLAAVTKPKWGKYVSEHSEGLADPNARDLLTQALEKQAVAVQEAQRADKEQEAALQNVQNELNLARRNEQDLQEKIAGFNEKLQSFLSSIEASAGEFNGSIEKALEIVQHEMVNVEKVLSEPREPMLHFFQNMLSMALSQQEHKACLGCGRDIHAGDDATFVEKFVKGRIQEFERRLGRNIEDDQAYLVQTQGDLRRLEQFQAQQDIAAEWRTQAADMRATIARHETERTSLMTTGRSTQEAVQEALERLDNLRSLEGTLSEYRARLAQAAALAEDATHAQRQLEELGQSPENAAELEALLQTTNKAYRESNHQVDQLDQERMEANRAVTAAERSLHAAKMLAVQKEQERRDRIAAQERAEEARRDLGQVEVQILEMDTTLDKIRHDLSPARARHSEALANLDHVEKQYRQSLEEVQAARRELSTLDQDIGLMQAQGNERKLETCSVALASLEEERAGLRTELSRLEEEANKVHRQRNEAGATERNLRDNLRYREALSAIEALQRQISEVDPQSRIDALNTLNNEYSELRRQEQERSGEAARMRGEMAGLTAQIKATHQELQDDYKHAKRRYLEKLIEHRLNERANRDLKKASQAIEASILQFHHAKMEEINQNINYLWGKTYQGVDIERIMIKAEADKSARRSYNYRVVMIKNGAEMDMRGRCSAGQKVLASIIIRLALAESFSMDCSLLALDEPTTNLDHQNIEALAKSLSDLIKEWRGSQGRSQLIVITHDETFLSRLAESGVLEWYNRVGRDAAGNSTIQVSTECAILVTYILKLRYLGLTWTIWGLALCALPLLLHVLLLLDLTLHLSDFSAILCEREIRSRPFPLFSTLYVYYVYL